jgi:uncharacterized protein (DUF2126 family)
MKTYFDTAVREGRYYSEDWTFCENWRDLGGKIWVDKRVLLKHTGTYVFDYAAQDAVYKQLHALAQSNPNGVAAPIDTPKPQEKAVKSRVLASNKSTAKNKTATAKNKTATAKTPVKKKPVQKTRVERS